MKQKFLIILLFIEFKLALLVENEKCKISKLNSKYTCVKKTNQKFFIELSHNNLTHDNLIIQRIRMSSQNKKIVTNETSKFKPKTINNEIIYEIPENHKIYENSYYQLLEKNNLSNIRCIIKIIQLDLKYIWVLLKENEVQENNKITYPILFDYLPPKKYYSYGSERVIGGDQIISTIYQIWILSTSNENISSLIIQNENITIKDEIHSKFDVYTFNISFLVTYKIQNPKFYYIYQQTLIILTNFTVVLNHTIYCTGIPDIKCDNTKSEPIISNYSCMICHNHKGYKLEYPKNLKSNISYVLLEENIYHNDSEIFISNVKLSLHKDDILTIGNKLTLKITDNLTEIIQYITIQNIFSYQFINSILCKNITELGKVECTLNSSLLLKSIDIENQLEFNVRVINFIPMTTNVINLTFNVVPNIFKEYRNQIYSNFTYINEQMKEISATILTDVMYINQIQIPFYFNYHDNGKPSISCDNFTQITNVSTHTTCVVKDYIEINYSISTAWSNYLFEIKYMKIEKLLWLYSSTLKFSITNTKYICDIVVYYNFTTFSYIYYANNNMIVFPTSTFTNCNFTISQICDNIIGTRKWNCTVQSPRKIDLILLNEVSNYTFSYSEINYFQDLNDLVYNQYILTVIPKYPTFENKTISIDQKYYYKETILNSLKSDYEIRIFPSELEVMTSILEENRGDRTEYKCYGVVQNIDSNLSLTEIKDYRFEEAYTSEMQSIANYFNHKIIIIDEHLICDKEINFSVTLKYPNNKSKLLKQIISHITDCEKLYNISCISSNNDKIVSCIIISRDNISIAKYEFDGEVKSVKVDISKSKIGNHFITNFVATFEKKQAITEDIDFNVSFVLNISKYSQISKSFQFKIEVNYEETSNISCITKTENNRNLICISTSYKIPTISNCSTDVIDLTCNITLLKYELNNKLYNNTFFIHLKENINTEVSNGSIYNIIFTNHYNEFIKNSQIQNEIILYKHELYNTICTKSESENLFMSIYECRVTATEKLEINESLLSQNGLDIQITLINSIQNNMSWNTSFNVTINDKEIQCDKTVYFLILGYYRRQNSTEYFNLTHKSNCNYLIEKECTDISKSNRTFLCTLKSYSQLSVTSCSVSLKFSCNIIQPNISSEEKINTLRYRLSLSNIAFDIYSDYDVVLNTTITYNSNQLESFVEGIKVVLRHEEKSKIVCVISDNSIFNKVTYTCSVINYNEIKLLNIDNKDNYNISQNYEKSTVNGFSKISTLHISITDNMIVCDHVESTIVSFDKENLSKINNSLNSISKLTQQTNCNYIESFSCNQIKYLNISINTVSCIFIGYRNFTNISCLVNNIFTCILDKTISNKNKSTFLNEFIFALDPKEILEFSTYNFNLDAVLNFNKPTLNLSSSDIKTQTSVKYNIYTNDFPKFSCNLILNDEVCYPAYFICNSYGPKNIDIINTNNSNLQIQIIQKNYTNFTTQIFSSFYGILNSKKPQCGNELLYLYISVVFDNQETNLWHDLNYECICFGALFTSSYASLFVLLIFAAIFIYLFKKFKAKNVKKGHSTFALPTKVAFNEEYKVLVS